MLIFEPDISQVQNGHYYVDDLIHFTLRESHCSHASQSDLHLLGIIDTRNLVKSTLVDQAVFLWVSKFVLLLKNSRVENLVKDVEVPFILQLKYHS
jgi:hypothetical protein